MFADVSADVKQQEIKELVALSWNVLWKVPSELEMQFKTGNVYFPLRTKNREIREGEGYLTEKSVRQYKSYLLTITKALYRELSRLIYSEVIRGWIRQLMKRL